jgi:hypothetical protein
MRDRTESAADLESRTEQKRSELAHKIASLMGSKEKWVTDVPGLTLVPTPPHPSQTRRRMGHPQQLNLNFEAIYQSEGGPPAIASCRPCPKIRLLYNPVVGR